MISGLPLKLKLHSQKVRKSFSVTFPWFVRTKCIICKYLLFACLPAMNGTSDQVSHRGVVEVREFF